MVTLGMLWLPILLATAIVFVAGAVLWMVSPHHRSDFRALPGEPGVIEVLRREKVSPGQYMLPYVDPKQMKDPAVAATLAEGPVGVLVLRRAVGPGMGKQLVQQFLYHLVVTYVLAYLASRTLAVGADYLAVFRLVGTTGILAYAAALVPNAVWFGRPWSVVARDVFDGLVWALLTAGVFGWLWPR